MKTEYQQTALKIPRAVTYGAGSLCPGDVLSVFFWLKGQERRGFYGNDLQTRQYVLD